MLAIILTDKIDKSMVYKNVIKARAVKAEFKKKKANKSGILGIGS